MSNMTDLVARMNEIAKYGTQNEDIKKQSTSTLYEHANAANGKAYGIVKECNRYYIKYTSPDKANLVETYQYIGGITNKGKFAFESHNEAAKYFEGQLSEINESYGGHTNVETLDPFKKNIVLAEATDKMQNDIARFRQIMHNVAILENATRSNDTVMCREANPEAETGKKGDKLEGSKDAKVVEQDNVKGTDGLKAKQTPYDKNVSEGCCSKCGKDKCECNESEENDWGSEGMDKGRDPKSIGWDIDGQKKVNEEADEKFSEGLPSSAGVGEADTDHNNAPFNKSVNEAEEDELDDVEGEDYSEAEVDGEDFEDEDDVDFDDDLNAEDDLSDEIEGEDELGGEDAEGDENFDDVELDDASLDNDEANELEELRAKVAELEAKVAELEGDGAEEDLLPADDDFEGEDFPEDEPMDDDFEGDFEGDDEDSYDEFGDDELEDNEDFEDVEFDDEDEDMYESKRNFMNRIVESVVKSFVNEDELHDFGKHPGYRKKPMQLPTTGQDKNEHGEDWNDESVHSEEPFGKQIGNGFPFNKLVNDVTKDVMYQLKHGVPIEGKNED